MKRIKKFNELNEENVQISSSGGLMCDNPDCDWEDMTIPVEDYEQWVNKKCPKCGEVVLTEEDYDGVQALLKSVEIVNEIDPDVLQKIADQMSDDPDAIIDAYKKLKEFGIEQVQPGGDEFKYDSRKKKK